MSKLNLKDVQSTKKRINSIEALKDIIPDDKMVMFEHKAEHVDIVAAKDTGKSFPVYVYGLQVLERDPDAIGIIMMKYSTQATKRGTRAFNSVYHELRRDYNFPYAYEPGQSFVYRMKDKKIKINNQYVEFGSFENTDAFANYRASNGGYPAYIIIDDPVMQDDTDVVDEITWTKQVKTLRDSVKRNWRDFKKEFHPKVPFKIFTLMNNWQPDHPVSQRAERFFPEMEFLSWALGFDYQFILNLHKDKLDGKTAIPAIKEWVDERWEEIKENVKKNHTAWKYIDTDEFGVKHDRLIGRMQKFANPKTAEDEELCAEIYAEMYAALITGSSSELARVFGMGADGDPDAERLFRFKDFKPTDTHKSLLAPGWDHLSFTCAWDHDANRGPVATPASLIGQRDRRTGEVIDIKVLIHPQVEIDGYGKGANGENTAKYHEQMAQISKDLIRKYDDMKPIRQSAFARFDDDNGAYTYRIAEAIAPFGYTDISPLPNKNGKIENGGFGTQARDELWQLGIDSGMIEVHKDNEGLIRWLQLCPVVVGQGGEEKRSTKGNWGKRPKDLSNSAEYAWQPWSGVMYEWVKREIV